MVGRGARTNDYTACTKSQERKQSTENENKAILINYFLGQDRPYSVWSGKEKGLKEKSSK